MTCDRRSLEPGLLPHPAQLEPGVRPEQGSAVVSRSTVAHLTRMEAASAALTVSFTAWFSFCALNTNMSIASWSSSVSMLLPIMVAFTVDMTLSWVPSVGIFSQTWKHSLIAS